MLVLLFLARKLVEKRNVLDSKAANISYEPKREYQMHLPVKPTPIPCLVLIDRVIITQHFFEPTREPAKTKTKAIV